MFKHATGKNIITRSCVTERTRSGFDGFSGARSHSLSTRARNWALGISTSSARAQSAVRKTKSTYKWLISILPELGSVFAFKNSKFSRNQWSINRSANPSHTYRERALSIFWEPVSTWPSSAYELHPSASERLPLRQSGGAAFVVSVPVDEMAFQGEVVVDVGVDRGELLQCLHPSEPQHPRSRQRNDSRLGNRTPGSRTILTVNAKAGWLIGCVPAKPAKCVSSADSIHGRSWSPTYR